MNRAMLTASLLFAVAAAIVGIGCAHNPSPPCADIENCNNPGDFPPIVPPPCKATKMEDCPVSATPTCAEVCAHVEDPLPRGLGCQTEHSCFENCQRVKPVRADAYRKCVRAAASCTAASACDQ